ncbi:hypothetical protein ABZ354_27445 [Streptomyces sp. NPDC005925]
MSSLQMCQVYKKREKRGKWGGSSILASNVVRKKQPGAESSHELGIARPW